MAAVRLSGLWFEDASPRGGARSLWRRMFPPAPPADTGVDGLRSAFAQLDEYGRAAQSGEHPAFAEPVPRPVAAPDPRSLSIARKALRDMPEPTRSIFAMHRLERAPYAEIARRKGLTVLAVEQHIAKASLFLADCLEAAE